METLTFLKGALHLRKKKIEKRMSSSALKQLIKHTFHNRKEGYEEKNAPIFEAIENWKMLKNVYFIY